jgi:hypothetical protein
VKGEPTMQKYVDSLEFLKEHIHECTPKGFDTAIRNINDKIVVDEEITWDEYVQLNAMINDLVIYYWDQYTVETV